MNDTVKNEDGGDSGGMLIASGGLTALVKAEIDMQITTARAFPRQPKKIKDALIELVTLDDASAEEAMYALPRGGKPIKGPSIRFAESVKQAYGNCRASTEISEVNKDLGYVEAVGVFHDLQTNVVTRIPHRRRITGRNGKVFPDDMIMVTSNAAASIAMRECILKGVPKPIWRAAYEAVERVISGDQITLAENREKAVKAFALFGVKPEQVFAALGVDGEADIVLDHIAVMRGMFSALKNGEETVESMFAKRGEKEIDKDHNPLVKKDQIDPDTGEVKSSTSTGGATDEVTKSTNQGDHRADSTSSTENRSAAAQQDGQTGAEPVTESEATQAGQASGDENKASANPAPTDAGTSAETSGSSQPNKPAADAGQQPQGSGEQAGDGKSGGDPKPSLQERLKSFSKALGTINDGGPAKLNKQADAWKKKWGAFAEGNEQDLATKIQTLHIQRLTGDLTADACTKKVGEVIG